MQLLLPAVIIVGLLLGGCTSSDEVQDGSPEACGNGVCDTIEQANNLCTQDCTATATTTTQASSTKNNLTLTDEEKAELLQITAAAYDDMIAVLQTAELDGIARQLNTIAATTEYHGIKPLYGTDRVLLSATENYQSAGTPWQRLVDAVTALQEGDQTVEFTYSFIVAGTDMVESESLELKDQQVGDVSHEQFTQEISQALAAWETLFESIFNPAHGYGGNLEVVFTNLGDETGNSFASNKDQSAYDIPGDENIGDFRYGMEPYDSLVTGTPFSPMTTVTDGLGEASGDVHYNSAIHWRTDDSTVTDATSVLIVTAHETGHGLAYQHETAGLMLPSNLVRGSFHELFPNGLIEDQAVVAATVALYGSSASTTNVSITVEGGSTVSLPTVTAATLGVSALTPDDAAKQLQAAQDLLQQYKEDLGL